MVKFHFDQISQIETDSEWKCWLRDNLLPNLSTFQLKRFHELTHEFYPGITITAMEELIGCIATTIEADHKFTSVLLSWINQGGDLTTLDSND